MPVAIVIKLGWLWFCALVRPFGVAMLLLSVVGGAVSAGIVLMHASTVPDAVGVCTIWLAGLPALAGMIVPLAVLYASIRASNAWKEGGEFVALGVSGVTVRTLLPPNLAVGALIAMAVGVGTHALGPVGHSKVQDVLDAASAVEPPTAPRAVMDVTSAVVDETGEGHGIRSSLGPPPGSLIGVRNANLAKSNGTLWRDIRRLERDGSDATAERLVAYKRSTMAAMAPLMLLLGLPLGAIGRWPAGIAGAVWLSLWALQRVGDQAAVSIGPSGAALLPLVVATCATWLLWVRWRAA
tara:strand:+ start:29 stop:916 length:888 start_codon:yes stop_codon:yes gene_type:complete